MQRPIVSVVSVTYNQASHIARMIEGVIGQKVDFPMEFIIADDCSTDGTLAVCEKYRDVYPSIIRIISGPSNIGAVANEKRAIEAARGKYIATCEGDDWWTNPLKLQKQVDFLEAHPDFSVCFHRYRKYHSVEDRFEDDGIGGVFSDASCEGVELSMDQFMHRWSTQYLTMVFRRDCYDNSLPERYKYFRDTHQVYHLMLRGRCYLFAFEGGVYNITHSGVYSNMDGLAQAQKVLAVDKELWKVNHDKRWKEMCAVVMQDMVDRYGASYVMRIFEINHNFPRLIKNLFHVVAKD